MVGLLWAIVVILVVLWLIGFVVVHVSSGLIHLLLIIALIVLLYNLFVGRRQFVVHKRTNKVAGNIFPKYHYCGEENKNNSECYSFFVGKRE